MNFRKCYDVSQIGIGERVQVEIGGVAPSPASDAEALIEILSHRVGSIQRGAVRQRVLQGEEIAPGLAHRYSLKSVVTLTHQPKAYSMRELADHHFRIVRA